jgi:putative transposase
MARPLRIEYPGAWYHLVCRGNERRSIFKGNADRVRFLVEMHAYVLMDNHFHLVVMTREPNLRQFIQRFNTTYAVYFNRRHRRSGHLYWRRYKSVLIDADNYLLEPRA